jgi:PAS domain S-box-containing protein
MMKARKLTYEELESRLFEAEDIIGALQKHEVDAIVGDKRVALVRLREVEEAVRQARAELERRVAERTTDLAQANSQLQNIVREQEQTRQQLEEYTSQLQDQAELLHLARDMIFVHDMDGRITFWNRGAELAYGWKREEALGQLSHKLLKTEYGEPLIRITVRIVRDGWWEGELIHTTRAGRKVTVASRWALRKQADGRPVAILEIDTDVTERRRAEQEMAEARKYAENIVATVQEALVVLDPQLAVLSANRSFCETFGAAPEHVRGRSLFSLNGGIWDVAQLRDKLAEVVSRNASFQDFELEYDAGVPRSFLLSARPIHGQVAGAEMVLLVIQDVTVRRRQQREIEADKQQLASLTEELMMMEERQRRQIAATLHDSIGQSLIFAKRELGALLQKVGPEAQNSLRQVADQIADAIKQTRDLTFELSPATLYTFGLQAAVEELAEQFAECEGFACRVEGPGEPMPIAGQVRAMLYRSVRELLVNVAKHAGAGNVVIALGYDGRRVKVVVQDDGRGFATGTLSECSREHGFGLFSIRERLTHIGGKFDIESVEGEGTRVTLVAPLDLGQQIEQAS